MAVAAWILFCIFIVGFGFGFLFLTFRHHYLKNRSNNGISE